MTRLLFGDVETELTNFDYYSQDREYNDLTNWQRIYDVGFVIYDMEVGKEPTTEFQSYIRVNYPIQKREAPLNTFTQRTLMKKGRDLSSVLKQFTQNLNYSHFFIGQNPEFDVKHIQAECFRMGLPIPNFPRVMAEAVNEELARQGHIRQEQKEE